MTSSIGSLYYLAYAQNHSSASSVSQLTGITFSVISLSILFHGSSATPLLKFYHERKTLFNARREHARTRTGT